MSSLPATWYDGKGSRPRAATLDCPEPGTLRVLADEVVLEFSAAELELSPRLGRMPRTLRLRPRRPSDVTDTIAAEGLRYPVILRIAGDHGGRSMVKMDGPDDLDPLFSIPWGGNTLYVTEFVDYRDDDGLYRKTRLVVVGDEYFVRHRVRWVLPISIVLAVAETLQYYVGKHGPLWVHIPLGVASVVILVMQCVAVWRRPPATRLPSPAE